MKIIFNIIIIVVILIVFGCSKKEEVSESIVNPPENPRLSLVEGKIAAMFIDTVSQVHAEGFLLAHNLSVYTLYHFNEPPPHSGIIDVPIGQEKA